MNIIDLFSAKNSFNYAELSSGEKRRLAFVVAMLEDKPIYLFDEWTSDQDPTFTKFFYENILNDLRKQEKIIIVVTHDERYFNCADKILKMELGLIKTNIKQPDATKL